MAHLVQVDVTVDMGINSSLRGIEKYAMQAEIKNKLHVRKGDR